MEYELQVIMIYHMHCAMVFLGSYVYVVLTYLAAPLYLSIRHKQVTYSNPFDRL